MLPTYPGRNVLLPLGNSQTVGSQSTAAVQGAGYRWLLQNLSIAAGKAINFVGSQVQGSFTSNQHEGYSGVNLAGVRTSSLAARVGVQAEIVLLDGPSVDFVTDGSSAAAIAGFLTTMLNDLYDRQAHNVPGGGSTLRSVIVTNCLRYPNDLVTINPRIIDYNANFFPGVIAAQQALGRDVSAIDVYNNVTIGADLLHPNDAGYTQWAALWMTALTNRLRTAA